MRNVLSVSPFQCRMWNCHDRLEDHITEETCREEIQSVLSLGQMIPVLARPLKPNGDHAYELIYGARRLFIARYLNVPLIVELKEMSDRDAVIALDTENRQRKELSPYERGLSYTNWLRAGLFSSQDELSKALNISASQISRLLNLAQLPAIIVSAFASPTQICESWGRDLLAIWHDPLRRSALAATARAIAKEPKNIAAPIVYQRLVAGAGTKGRSKHNIEVPCHDEVVKDSNGRPLFRVRLHRKEVALLLPAGTISSESLDEIKGLVSVILQRASSQLIVPISKSAKKGCDAPDSLAPLPMAVRSWVASAPSHAKYSLLPPDRIRKDCI